MKRFIEGTWNGPKAGDVLAKIEGDPTLDALSEAYTDSAGRINLSALESLVEATEGEIAGELENLLEEGREAVGGTVEASFIEESEGFFEEARIDRESGIIANVSLLGPISKNGRRYTRDAMEDAARLYEGVGFYLDHPTKKEMRERKGVRSIRDLAGKIRNPRIVGDRVRGDIQVLATESVRDILFAVAEMPDAAGPSHRAAGKIRPGRKKGEPDVVESLSHVAGVDLVTSPATVEGLFESLEDDPTEDEPMDLTTLKEKHPDLVEAILDEHKETAEVNRLKAENERLREWKEEREEADRREEWESIVESHIEESDLPERMVTDEFRRSLMEAKDVDALERLIADREKVFEEAKLELGSGKPRSREKGHKISESRKDGEAPDLEEAHEALFVG